MLGHVLQRVAAQAAVPLEPPLEDRGECGHLGGGSGARASADAAGEHAGGCGRVQCRGRGVRASGGRLGRRGRFRRAQVRLERAELCRSPVSCVRAGWGHADRQETVLLLTAPAAQGGMRVALHAEQHEDHPAACRRRCAAVVSSHCTALCAPAHLCSTCKHPRFRHRAARGPTAAAPSVLASDALDPKLPLPQRTAQVRQGDAHAVGRAQLPLAARPLPRCHRRLMPPHAVAAPLKCCAAGLCSLSACTCRPHPTTMAGNILIMATSATKLTDGRDTGCW